MIRNMFLYIIVLAICIFAAKNFTNASLSVGELGVYIEKDDWVVLFNNFQEFYDDHELEVSVFADEVYDGWYTGDGYVTGKLAIVGLDERAEGFLGGNGGDTFYLGGCHASLIPAAQLTFWGHPNVDIPGNGWGWGRIYGTKGDGSFDMAEDSQYFHFNGDSSDVTPKCDACTDANPNCPQAGNRHFWRNRN